MDEQTQGTKDEHRGQEAQERQARVLSATKDYLERDAGSGRKTKPVTTRRTLLSGGGSGTQDEQ